MQKLIISLILISLTLLAGCRFISKVNVKPKTKEKPSSLTIEPKKETERKWSTEIVAADKMKKDDKKNDKPDKEEVPTEFVFPRQTEKVGSTLTIPEYDDEMVDFNLNFKNADIKAFLYDVFRERLKVNYIIDKRVAGTISLSTSGKINKAELFTIVQSVLDLQGYAIVQEGQLYKILPLQDARQIPGPVYNGDKIIKDGKDIIIQIVPIKYIAPQEIIPTLRTFLTKGGTAVSPNDTHVIIIVDDASNMDRLISILKTFDLPFFAGKALKFYDIKNLDVKNLAKHLESIAGTLGANTKGKKADLAFLPFVESGKLLVATRMPELYQTIEMWIKNLDIMPSEGERVRTYIYKMQHILADQVAPIISEVFKEEIEQIKKAPKSVSKKELKVIPDAGTNSLIIRATQTDYYRIKAIIDELDATPQQVLIEVIIAEVKLNDNLQYGVQFFLRDRFQLDADGAPVADANDREVGVKLSPIAAGAAAIEFANQSENFEFLFNAIGGESTFEFLSTPNILVRDDQTATIQVGEDQPIVSGATSVGETVTENVQYRAVGIILTVTPHIGENGLVTLDITQEDSETAGEGVRNNPVFTTRRAETSLVVKDNHTILIGGIIETRETVNITKIPLIGDIPYIGNLFKSRSIRKDKTELLVLITPHVIDTANDAKILTKKFEHRLKAIDVLMKKGGG